MLGKGMCCCVFFCHDHDLQGRVHHQSSNHSSSCSDLSCPKDSTDGTVSSSFQDGPPPPEKKKKTISGLGGLSGAQLHHRAVSGIFCNMWFDVFQGNVTNGVCASVSSSSKARVRSCKARTGPRVGMVESRRKTLFFCLEADQGAGACQGKRDGSGRTGTDLNGRVRTLPS